MQSLFQELAQGLQNFGTGAYLLVFVIVLLETIVAIGQFVPGSVFLAIMGFMCFARIFDFTGMLFSVYSAHFLGEMINYYIGRKKGRALFQETSRFFKPRFLELAETKFQQSGARILIVGQFLGFLRPFLSVAAGATHYSLAWFIPVALVSTFLWALVHLGIGFLCGASWQRAVDYLEGLAFGVLVIVFTAILSSWAMRWLSRLLVELGRMAERLAVRLRGSPRYVKLASLHPPVFRFLERRLSFSRRWGFGATLGFLVAIYFVGLSLGILAQIRNGIWWHHLDPAVLNLLAQLRRPETDNIFLVITHLGSAPVVWTAVVVAIALSLHGRQYKSTFVIAGSVVLSVLLSQMLKFGYGRERPDVSLRMVAALGYSFPSGHSAVSFAFFGALYYWLWNHPGIFRLRVFLAFVVILTSLLIGFSRMYLGVHYPSDVVAGFCLGLASVIFCATVAANWENLTDVPRRADWATCATVCFQIGGAILYAKMHAIKPPAEYVQNVTPRAFESMDDLLKVIPDHSSTLLGQRQLPVTIVGIGSQDELTTHLRALQWKSNRASDFFTRQLSSPVFPAFVNSKPALVTMENRTSTTRTILRAWDLPYTLQGRKVWLGAITMERLQKRWREFRVFRVDPDQDFCLNSFRESLTTAPLSVEIMPHFRERGLYNWNHEFFTHGMGLTILGE